MMVKKWLSPLGLRGYKIQAPLGQAGDRGSNAHREAPPP